MLMTQKGLLTWITGGIMLLFIMACSDNKPAEYGPGQVVPERILSEGGADSFFICQEIPDTIFAFMQGRSYKDDCTVPRSDLRYLLFLHRNLDGQAVIGDMHVDVLIDDTGHRYGEIVGNRDLVSQDLVLGQGRRVGPGDEGDLLLVVEPVGLLGARGHAKDRGGKE